MHTPANAEIAEIFLRIGDMMDYKAENAFKVRSYWRAAEVLLALPEPVSDIAARGELQALPGIGEAIASKIQDILTTGTCPLYERLKTEVSPSIRRLLRLPGLTPRLVRILEQERQLRSPEDLADVIATDLEDVSGLSINDRAQLLRARFAS
jgi:DNA polymerase (family 10)